MGLGSYKDVKPSESKHSATKQGATMTRLHSDRPTHHSEKARQRAAFDRLHQRLRPVSRAGCGLATGNSPPINVLKRADMAIVTAVLPGLRPGELKIEILDNTVKLSGCREFENVVEPGIFQIRERYAGPMERQINFPFSIDVSRAHASFACGIMILQLPRLQPGVVEKIDIDPAVDYKFVISQLGRLVDEIKQRGLDKREPRRHHERNHTKIPRSDIYEGVNSFRLIVDLPGVYDDIDISIEDNMMSIDARVNESNFADCELVFSEYNLMDYKREFKLLDTIDQNNIMASLRDGLLTVTLPKLMAQAS